MTEAVITIPSYFNKEQIRETKEAGEKAGLKVLECLHEPVAAAIAYGHANNIENAHRPGVRSRRRHLRLLHRPHHGR